MLTKGQIQISVDVRPLLETSGDCLRFVTEFFEVISQSGPHIYHSALQLSPHSSLVRGLCGQYISSPTLRVVTGTPASWDSCTASAGTTTKAHHAVWSPCGQLVAVGLVGRMDVRDPITLEIVSILKPSNDLTEHVPESLGFSPDGRLFACSYRG